MGTGKMKMRLNSGQNRSWSEMRSSTAFADWWSRLWLLLQCVFPRHRWHGGELAVDTAGLLFAVHNIGGEALRRYFCTKGIVARGLPPQAPAPSQAQALEAGLSEQQADGADPGSVEAVDACVAETEARAQPAQSAQGDAAGQAQDATQLQQPLWHPHFLFRGVGW